MGGINPASTENFFFDFWSDFSVCFPIRPLNMRFERKIFLSVPEVCFLDATRFVRLVLTGVRVANFFNIAYFDLIFLHNTHILAVFLSVVLFSFLICLSCLSVCMSVFSTEGMYVRTFVYLSICLFVFLPSCTFALSVCLSVCLCMSVYVSTSLFLFVCMCI
jgi:hypothetical protein